MKLRAVLPPLKDINGYKQVHNGVVNLQAIETRFLSLIAQQMGFSYELMLPVDGQFGLLKPDGNWTGIIGMIQRDEADLSVAYLSMTEHRLLAIDFSESYGVQDQSFVTELPGLLPNTFFYVHPFNLSTWLVVFSVMIGVAFVLKSSEGFGADLMTVLRGLCRQPLRERSYRTVFRKLLLYHWIYFADLVTLSYSAILLSFLTVPLRNKGLETIEDLSRAVKEGSYKALVPKGSSAILGHLLSSDNENMKELGRAILNNHWEYDTREGIENYFEYGTALIGHKMRFRGAAFSRRFISKDSFGIWNVGVALNRRFCCKKRLNTILRRMLESGLYQKIFKEEEFISGIGQQSESDKQLQGMRNQKLGIDGLYGLFAMLGVGYLASGVALVFELVWNRVQDLSTVALVRR